MNNYAPLSDNELIQLYLKGDSFAFSNLVNRHKSKIYSAIYILVKDEHLAEDFFQEVFIRIIESFKKGTYVENGKFLSWAIRIANNLCVDHFRRTRRNRVIKISDGYDIFEQLGFSEPAVDVKMMQIERNNSVKKAIDQLPQDLREIIILRHYANLSFREISAISGISINTALGRMRYALINIRKLLPEKHLA